MDVEMGYQKPLLFVAVLLIAIYAAYSVGFNRATNDYRGTAEQLRSELRTATEINRSLKADNERISKINSQLAGEIGESRRIAGTIGDYNRENENRLDEAGNIVTECQRIAGEVRKGNKGKDQQPAR